LPGDACVSNSRASTRAATSPVLVMPTDPTGHHSDGHIMRDIRNPGYHDVGAGTCVTHGHLLVGLPDGWHRTCVATVALQIFHVQQRMCCESSAHQGMAGIGTSSCPCIVTDCTQLQAMNQGLSLFVLFGE